MSRKINISNTDLCTTDIDDNLLYQSKLANSVLPTTENLSEELSALIMPKRRTKTRKYRELSNNYNIYDNNSISLDKVKTDIATLYNLIRKINKDIETLQQNGGNKSRDISPLLEINSRLNLKSSKADLAVLDKKIQKLETTIQHVAHKSNKRGIGDPHYNQEQYDCDTHPEIYQYIDCKINEKVDELIAFVNDGFIKCDEDLENLKKILINALKNYPVSKKC